MATSEGIRVTEVEIKKYGFSLVAFRVLEAQKRYDDYAGHYWSRLFKVNKASFRSLARVAGVLEEACVKNFILRIPCNKPKIYIAEPDIDFERNGAPKNSASIYADGVAEKEAIDTVFLLIDVQEYMLDRHVLVEENKPKIMTPDDVSEDSIRKACQEVMKRKTFRNYMNKEKHLSEYF